MRTESIPLLATLLGATSATAIAQSPARPGKFYVGLQAGQSELCAIASSQPRGLARRVGSACSGSSGQ
jgi:hypothetical protein